MLESKATSVQNYYGKELKSSSDLKTNACCTPFSYPTSVKKALSNISDEVLSKYYGCGLAIPKELMGLSVLDLGSGSGRDCFILSQLVGEGGQIVGVDMTDEQLEVARNNIDWHTQKFGYKKPNVEFLKGDLEELHKLGFSDQSFDLIISNCVINLVPNKEAVLKETYRLLKPGGEFYFSDVYSDRRIPKHLVDDPVLYGECLSGAMYSNDFIFLAKKMGFHDPRVVETHPITIENSELENRVRGFNFESTTYRLFKIPQMDSICEDYGQAVVYKGSIAEKPDEFMLDDGHIFVKGKTELVCGNTFRMLNETRFKNHFEFIGNFETHFGVFGDCGTQGARNIQAEALGETGNNTSPAAACC